MENMQRKYFFSKNTIIKHREMRLFWNFQSKIIENGKLKQNDKTIEKLYFIFLFSSSLLLFTIHPFPPEKKIFSGYLSKIHLEWKSIRFQHNGYGNVWFGSCLVRAMQQRTWKPYPKMWRQSRIWENLIFKSLKVLWHLQFVMFICGPQN